MCTRCVLDLVALADSFLPNCDALRVCLDERSFGTESLLHPVGLSLDLRLNVFLLLFVGSQSKRFHLCTSLFS